GKLRAHLAAGGEVLLERPSNALESRCDVARDGGLADRAASVVRRHEEPPWDETKPVRSCVRCEARVVVFDFRVYANTLDLDSFCLYVGAIMPDSAEGLGPRRNRRARRRRRHRFGLAPEPSRRHVHAMAAVRRRSPTLAAAKQHRVSTSQEESEMQEKRDPRPPEELANARH